MIQEFAYRGSILGMIDRPGGRCPTNHRFAFCTVLSTHAAQESGGLGFIPTFAMLVQFPSTLSSRVATYVQSITRLSNRFQSTPPSRVATAEHHGLVYKFLFQPTPPFERRHIRKIERRGKNQPALRRFSFPPPSHPAPMRKAACWPRADTHFIPRRPLSGQLSGIPMIWERPFHPRSPACRHQAGSLPISNPCFNPHGPFGR